MGVEALCQVSKINGSCHLKMVDAGVSGCYHYYMSDGEYHYKDAGANITYHIARGMKWRTEDIFTESFRKSGG